MAICSKLLGNSKNQVAQLTCMLGQGAPQTIVCWKGPCNFDKDFLANLMHSSFVRAKLDESATLKEMLFS